MSDRRDYKEIVEAIVEGSKPHTEKIIKETVNGNIKLLHEEMTKKFEDLNIRLDEQDKDLGLLKTEVAKLEPVSEALTFFQLMMKALKYLGIPTTALIGYLTYLWLK